MDGTYANGCECAADGYEASGGATCAAAVSLGSLADNPGGYVDIVGNLVPSGDVDWYRITASDDADTSADEFDFEVYFTSNPGGLAYDVYKGGCSDSTPCTAVTDCMNWYTDFIDATSGESPCRSTVTGGYNLCTNDGRDFYIRVYRASGGTVCTNYTLRIANNQATNGPGCLHKGPCDSPTTVTVNSTTSGTTTGNPNTFTGSCGGASGPDKIYRLVLASAMDVFIAAFSTAFNPVLYMGTTCGGSGSGCNDNAYSGVNSSVLILNGLAAGTYYITVDSASTSGGTFSLEIYGNADAASGSTCGQPLQLSNGATGSSCVGSHDYTPSCATGSTAQEAVFYFIEETARTVQTNTCTYTWDSVIYYRDVCYSGTEPGTTLACDDDGCGYTAQGSVVNYTFSPGVYFFVLDGYSTGCGSYNLYFNG